MISGWQLLKCYAKQGQVVSVLLTIGAPDAGEAWALFYIDAVQKSRNPSSCTLSRNYWPSSSETLRSAV
jgi:hypothetical protein